MIETLGETQRPCPACGHQGEPDLDQLQALEVQCLGYFAVRLGGRTLGPWPNRRAKALFKYLVLHRDRPVHKEVLMDVFWPGVPLNAARNSLNVAIHALRRFLREVHADVPHVLFQDGSYQLDPGVPLRVDVEEWERLASSALALHRTGRAAEAVRALQAADALYHGPLFEDDPYDEWALERRRDLEDAYVAVLELLRDHHLAEGDVVACKAVARRILAIEPTSEETHRALMAVYARRGQHHLALRQYRDCVAVLRDVLDTRPGEATERLGARLRRREAV
jgi:DNA-binding SARP family transcriptional activator